MSDRFVAKLHYAFISDLLVANTGITAATETRLIRHDTAACIADISPKVYTFHHQPRLVGRCVGVEVWLSTHFKVSICSIHEYSSFEFTCGDIPFIFLFIATFHLPLSPSGLFFKMMETLARHSKFYILYVT